MDNKTTRTLTILVAIASVSVVLLGVGIATGLSPYYYSSSADVYKHVACIDKVHEFAQRGIVRDTGGFHGAIFECSQIQWSRSIYE